jgi:4-hydroxybenzoate polyprenyltransferase
MLKKIAILLEMIKFEHTVFALPFAFMGAFLSSRGVPGPATLGWIVLAMVGARTCAMGFNRIVDRKFDELNPRTASRALPAKAVMLPEAWAMVILAAGIFFFACYNLNQLTLILSPFALALTLLLSPAPCKVILLSYLPGFCSGLQVLIQFMPAWMPTLMPK